MARIQPVDPAQCAPAVNVALQRHLKDLGGYIDQTQASLARSLPAFEAYKGYNLLYRELANLIDEKELLYYSHQVSIATGSPIAAARYRKQLCDSGVDPAGWEPDERLEFLVFFGTCVVKNKGRIADHIFRQLEKYYSHEELVLLVAYTGQLIALNIFDNVIETEADDYLQPYLQPASALCLKIV